jgi:hypothetical protein
MKFNRIAGAALGLAVTAAALLPGVAGAETVSSALTAGGLSLASQPITFANTTLTGANQTITATPTSPWTLSDSRGTGSAWTATISATAPTSAAGTVETLARTIAVGNLGVTAGTVSGGTGSDSATNISGASGLALTTSAQTLVSSTGNNKGNYTFSPGFSFAIPANAYRSNYSAAVGTTALNPYISTLTLTIS